MLTFGLLTVIANSMPYTAFGALSSDKKNSDLTEWAGTGSKNMTILMDPKYRVLPDRSEIKLSL